MAESTMAYRKADGTITTAASIVGPFDVTDFATAIVAFSGTYAGVTVNFEVSLDQVTWYPVNFTQMNAATTTSAPALGTNATVAFEGIIGPFLWFRIRASAWTSGTAVVQTSLLADSVEPAPNVQVTNTPAVTISGTPTVTNTATPLSTTGGVATNHHLVAAATTNATSVKATAGAIGHIVMANVSAAVKFVKLFNKATAPVVGTDTPTVTFLIPAGATLIFDPANYYRMSAGIAYAITGAAPDLDATAVAAGDVIVSMNYS